MLRFLPAILLLTFVSAANAADYYVAPIGGADDTSHGSSPDTPWATIGHAAANTVAGDTIHLAAGTYPISARFELDPGVSLIGADAEDATATVLRVDNDLPEIAYLNKSAVLFIDNNVSWQSVAEGDQELQHFTIAVNDGAHFGIFTIGLHRVRIHNVHVSDARDSGIAMTSYWFSPASWDADRFADGCEISHCRIVSSARDTDYPNGGNSHNLETRGWRGGSIHHNVIIDIDNGDRGGFGMGGQDLIGVAIYDNQVTVGNENPVWKGMFTMEYRNLANGCDIHDNELNNGVSLVGDGHVDEGYERSVIFHHNRIYAPEEHTMEMVEVLSNHATVHHNDFTGGGVTLLLSNKAGEPAVEDIVLHHNVHREGHGILSAFATGSVHRNIVLYNNTFYGLHNEGNQWASTTGGFYLNGTNENVLIANNIIAHFENRIDSASPYLLNVVSGATLHNVVFSHNLVHDYGSKRTGDQAQPVTWTDNLDGVAPGLRLSGADPDPYYRPLPDSPVVGAGTTTGLPDDASTTIGAYAASAARIIAILVDPAPADLDIIIDDNAPVATNDGAYTTNPLDALTDHILRVVLPGGGDG